MLNHKRKNIIFDARIHLGYMCGLSRYIINLLDNILAIDHENSYTVIVNQKLTDSDELITVLNKYQNVSIIKSSIYHFGPLNTILAPLLINRLKGDLYHFPHINCPNVNMPTIITVHDADVFSGVERITDSLGFKKKYLKYSTIQSIKRAEKVIFISEATKNDFKKIPSIHLSDRKCNVVYHGLTPKMNEIDKAEEDLFLKNNQISDGDYFFFVGVIRPHKNVLRIIEAFTSIDFEDKKLVIVGKAYMDIKPFIINNNNIIYLETVSDKELSILYKNALSLVFPSLLEGFGFPIIEAMNAQLPVITSNHGAMKEISGNAALFVDALSVSDLKEKMVQIATDKKLRDSLVENGNKRVKEFRWEKSAEETLRIYKQLL